jgi:thiamine biosynthesis lipoprotein
MRTTRALAIATALTLASTAYADTPPPTPEPAPAPAAAPRKIVKTGKVMGTNVQVTFWTGDDAAATRAFGDVMTELQRIDAMMTTWTPDSEVSKINANAGGKAVAVSDETLAVITRALEVSKKSKGVFDITVGAFKGLWKFDQDMDGTLPAAEDVAARLKLVSWKDVVVDARKKTVRLRKKDMAITLGGIAKGYAVDKAAAVLRKAGFDSFILQVGGDLYVAGKKSTKPWVVGIRDPRGPADAMFAVADVEDASFSTSGDYERGFVKDGKRYHHILDPRTGFPADKSRSVTVMAKDAFTADAWSKVLFILGADATMAEIVEKLPDFEAVYVDDKNQVRVSTGLDKKLKILKQPTPGP